MTASDDAEMYAALNGIYIAMNRGASHILVRSDNMSVCLLIRGKVKSPRLLRKWQEGIERLGIDPARLSSRHVKGHQKHIVNAAGYVNDWCDKHAKKGRLLGLSRTPKQYVQLGNEQWQETIL